VNSSELRAIVENAFESRSTLSAADIAALAPRVNEGLAGLDCGEIRVAEPRDGEWVTHDWVKKLILLAFATAGQSIRGGNRGSPKSYDKFDLKFDDWEAPEFGKAGVRVTPGAVVRRGAFLGRGVILMPCFVNIGAHVGERTMVDTWATVGSCAQVGADCHISGGAGIGGVLEPINDRPVVIEDNVFIGARAEIAEGVRVRRGAVIGMGTFIGRSTPIVERDSGIISYGEVPENAVVIPGSIAHPGRPEISTFVAVIVKQADTSTRAKTSLNPMVRAKYD